MKEVYNHLTDKLEELNDIISQAEKFLEKAPEGALRIAHCKGTTQYYLHLKEAQERYIRKSEGTLIQSLAQKGYAQKTLQEARAQKKTIEKFLKEYHPEKIGEVLSKLSVPRQKLVMPYLKSDEEYVAQWKDITYSTKYIAEEDTGIYTENDEIVRSKSEKILADKFKTMNIPYHYEKPLYLNGYGTVYPDFTVLNVRTRREYYWEHLGLMDNEEYCDKAIKKIETMAKNGIFPGKNLILTFETATHPLNSKIVDLIIEEFLL